MKIVFTKHALGKFTSLKLIGWIFKKKDIKEAVKSPDYFSEDQERGVKIVLKEIDNTHNLRVIYTEHGVIITIVTFYPTEKGRYYENS